MNSGVLVKIDDGASWRERLPGARGARFLLVMGGTIIATLSVPVPLIEQVATASGLAGMTQYVAAPIGFGTRLVVGCGLALVPAAAVWALGRETSRPDRRVLPNDEAEHQEFQDEDEMINAAYKQAPASALGALLRLVRGGFHDESGSRGSPLSRRRRDRHPDAPPRPPLFASRDLPSHETMQVEDIVEQSPATEPEAIWFPIEQEAVVVPSLEAAEATIVMPRAPEPLSDQEIADAMAVIASRIQQGAGSASGLRSHVRRDASELLCELDLPLIENAPLATLANRFEQGLATREAVVHARNARQSLGSSIAYVQPDDSVRSALRAHRPLELVRPVSFDNLGADTAEDPGLRVARDVELALDNALATLRTLAAQGRR